jgi:hypothetical protein
LRTFTGIGAAGAHVPFSLLSEFLSVKLRGSFLLYIEIFWTIGAIFEAGLAWALLPNLTLPVGGYDVGTWRILLVVSSIPMFLVLIFLPLMPESPRYLYVTKQYDEAQAVLNRMIYLNRKEPLHGYLARDVEDENGEHKGTSAIEGLKLLFSSRYWRITIILLAIWFVNSFAYYGAVVMTPSFFKTNAGDASAYVEVFITSAAEFPGVIVALLLINKVGRKKTQGFLFLMCGVCMFLLMIPTGKWLLTIFAIGARLAVMGAFSSTFVMTPEVFPTKIRSTGLGVCSAFSRLAGIITPYVATALFKVNAWIPLIIYGVACILGGVLTFLIPVETSGKYLVDNEEPIKQVIDKPVEEIKY